jgi:hypothetical protein
MTPAVAITVVPLARIFFIFMSISLLSGNCRGQTVAAENEAPVNTRYL